jgi:hypothetical protein
LFFDRSTFWDLLHQHDVLKDSLINVQTAIATPKFLNVDISVITGAKYVPIVRNVPRCEATGTGAIPIAFKVTFQPCEQVPENLRLRMEEATIPSSITFRSAFQLVESRQSSKASRI